MFSAIKRALGVCTADNHDHPYYLTRYFCRLIGAMLGGVVPAGGPVVAETVPYAVPDVGQEELKCPVCHQQFQTNYGLQRHMDIHKGSGYPCSSCHKSLTSYKMLRQHKAACKLGRKHTCALCNKEYSSLQILKTEDMRGCSTGLLSLNLDSPSPALIVVRPTWSRNQ